MQASLTRRGMLGVAAGAVAHWMGSTAHAQPAATDKTLVFLCLRGGADGLSLLVPQGDDGYYRARPRIAIARPGVGSAAAVHLEERFALHPCLAGWRALFDRGQAGARVDVGLRSHWRSHRAAQRALDDAIVQALDGAAPELLKGNLTAQLQGIAATLSPEKPRAVVLESFGWDTHVAQGQGTSGRLARASKELEQAVLAFEKAAAQNWQYVRLAIVTELGRTLTESRTGGTDDAYASVLFTFGPRQSGRVLGSYGTLEPGCAYAERSRAPTVDLQTALHRFVRDQPCPDRCG